MKKRLSRTLSKLVILAIMLSFFSSSIPLNGQAEGTTSTITTLSDARLLGPSYADDIIIEGIVTHVNGKNAFVQDDTAGVVVRATNASHSISAGDRIKVTGKTAEYYGMFQIETITDNVVVIGTGTIEPEIITAVDLAAENGEAFEGKLVKIVGVTVNSVDTNSNYSSSDSQGSFLIRSNNGLVEVNQTYTSITGVIDYHFSEYKLTPRTVNDVHSESTGPTIIDTLTIAEIQGADSASPYDGQTVITKGIVTGLIKDGYFIQDSSNAWSGIYVYDKVNTPIIGTEIQVTGDVKEYYSFTELTNLSDYQELSTNNIVFDPIVLTTSQLSNSVTAEQYEGMLVRVENVLVTNENAGYGEWQVQDSSGIPLLIDDSASSGTYLYQPVKDDVLTFVQGPLNYTFSKYKIAPRNDGDFGFDQIVLLEAKVIDATTLELIFNTGIEGSSLLLDSVNYSVSDALSITSVVRNAVASNKLVLTTGTQGSAVEYTVTISNVDRMQENTFTFSGFSEVTQLNIHDIQGESHTSPFVGQIVSNIEGVVTAKDGSNGFYMQSQNPDNNEKTSEGIYVYKSGGSGVTVGDLVSVTGEVKEWKQRGYSNAVDLLTTQITASAINVISQGHASPTPIVIGIEGRIQPTQIIDNDQFGVFDPEEDAIDFYESLEGMLIQLNNAKILSPIKYDEVVVAVDNGVQKTTNSYGGLMLTQGNFNPERIFVNVKGTGIAHVKVGDSFNGSIVGVVGYDYSNFKVKPTQAMPILVDGGVTQESVQITQDISKLTIASYNIENFHAGEVEKMNKLANSFIQHLKTPDIIGIIEMQDDSGKTDDGETDATQNYEALIAAIQSIGGPVYDWTDIAPQDKVDGGIPGGNIRVGFLYNTERVVLVDKEKGDATTAVDVDDAGSLTLNPGRIDPTHASFAESRKPLAAEFDFNGERVIVIANHMNSKSGDDAPFGGKQPIVLGSETQRLQQATVIHDFIQKVVNKNPNTNMVVLGDLNDFEFSAPVQTLKGNLLTNMIDKISSEDRFTYNYQGNAQVLDHILVTNNLADFSRAEIVTLNSLFDVEHGRTSDHDPVYVQVDLTKTDRIQPIDECFIATAAFGSKFGPAVTLLRGFRDQFLLTNSVGQTFVEFYYTHSPKIANIIRENEFLKGTIRVTLAPLVAMAYLMLNPGILTLVIAAMAAAVYWFIRRRKGQGDRSKPLKNDS